MVNGHASERRPLPQAGLPQGLPLSPIFFLFFNADLVQSRVGKAGGSMAFVDDYSAWVTGPTAEANRVGIQAIIDRALDWERRSGATFEGDKTTIIHFTRDARRTSDTPFVIKGEEVKPAQSAKILGVVMDAELRYKEHIARTAAKGLAAAMCLKRLKMLAPSTARQLFTATVAPTMDYASTVWAHACGAKELGWLYRAQKIGAEAFRTAAAAVVEVEASIPTIRERHTRANTSFYINLKTLPRTHPLANLKIPKGKRYVSPMKKIAETQKGNTSEEIETINAYALPPWQRRIRTWCELDRYTTTEVIRRMKGIIVVTSASERAGVVGCGATVRDTSGSTPDKVVARYMATAGSRDDQNVYTAELVAMAEALRRVPDGHRNRQIVIATSNRAALEAIARPRQQSGQCTIREIYRQAERLQVGDDTVARLWVPSEISDLPLGGEAKAEARKATQKDHRQEVQTYQARATRLRRAITRQQQRRTLPIGIGKFSKRIDKALPGTHTRALYDRLKRREADILSQLRTGMARVNSYLYRIGAAESDTCECGQGAETIEHFLFRCTKWDTQRENMRRIRQANIGNLSVFLGGKQATDGPKWAPDLEAVRATIRFAINTKRLDADQTRRIATDQTNN